MKSFTFLIAFLLTATIIILTNDAIAQRNAMNGYSIPVDKPVRIMTVFAQIDQTNCGGSGSDNWPDGSLPLN